VRLRVVTRPLDDDRPLLDLPPTADALAWVRRGEGLVGWGEALRVRPGPGPDRMRRAEAALRVLDAEVDDPVALPGSGLVAFGSFSFSPASAASVLRVPRRVVGRHEGRTFSTSIDVVDDGEGDHTAASDLGRHAVELPDAADRRAEVPGPATSPPTSPPRDRPRYAGSSKPDVHWLEAVADAVARIRAGELEKVVLARDHAVWSREPFDALDLARRLAARFPSCHAFVVDGLVGATPELLLSRRGEQVVSRALAGTTGRSDDEAEDAELGARLLASAKDLHEHALAAESVEEVLRPHCRRLEADPGPRLLRLDNVQHLATTFHGELAHPATSLQLAAELHPTAAVGGTPRATALALIDELEGLDRGRYAAPVGWTDVDGDGEWGIALRCAELTGARARLFAGVGVVDASLPEDELEETRLKLRAMQAALGEDPGAA
jgi:menaquinone-specific isochorismate synthase